MTGAPGRGRVLYVEDSALARGEIAAYLREEGFEVLEADSAEAALEIAAERTADVALVDIGLPRMDGIGLIRRLRVGAGCVSPEVPVIVLTGAGTIERAFEAGQLHVTAFLQKPVGEPDDLVALLDDAIEQGRRDEAARGLILPPRETDTAPRPLRTASGGESVRMVGNSAAIAQILAAVQRVAPTSARVLITGESGTGKELVARAMHDGSPRRAGPFIEVNCAAIPRELVESELFGHEKGAFTGAAGAKAGRLEMAHGGTLFLDEVGDMSLAAQATLLRTIETGRLQRVGGTRQIDVDVRIVAATNKALETEVREGRFREDLYYRLNVVRIHLPPLRERRDDIAALATYFLARAAPDYARPDLTLGEDAVQALRRYDWPGNIRELKNAVDRLAIFAESATITGTDVATALRETQRHDDDGDDNDDNDDGELRGEVRRREMAVIVEALSRCNWNVSEAARQLGIARASLHRKIKEYGLEREPHGP